MNSSAPYFFAITKQILFDELILTISRLTDKPRGFGRDNASIEQLIEQIKTHGYAELATDLMIMLRKFRREYDFFQLWRHRRVSHSDLLTVLGKSTDPLPGISRHQVEGAIKDIVDIINEFSQNTQDTIQVFEPFLVARGDGNALLQALRQESK
jgi:hypothetical protein